MISVVLKLGLRLCLAGDLTDDLGLTSFMGANATRLPASLLLMGYRPNGFAQILPNSPLGGSRNRASLQVDDAPGVGLEPTTYGLTVLPPWCYLGRRSTP